MLHSSIYIASDGILYPTRVEILSFDGLRFQRVWEGRIPPPGNAFAVDVADVNGDGRAEIFVTSYGAGRLASFVLEYDGKEFRRIWEDQALFFRAVPNPGGQGSRIFAQRVIMDDRVPVTTRDLERRIEKMEAPDPKTLVVTWK